MSPMLQYSEWPSNAGSEVTLSGTQRSATTPECSGTKLMDACSGNERESAVESQARRPERRAAETVRSSCIGASNPCQPAAHLLGVSGTLLHGRKQQAIHRASNGDGPCGREVHQAGAQAHALRAPQPPPPTLPDTQHASHVTTSAFHAVSTVRRRVLDACRSHGTGDMRGVLCVISPACRATRPLKSTAARGRART